MTAETSRLRRIALANAAVAVTVLALKYAGYALTGSVALYSDALESTLNVATAMAVFIAVQCAARPADSQHPYGHHKAEFVAGAAVGVLILAAAFAILREAYIGYVAPQPIDPSIGGLAFSVAASIGNLLWAGYLIRQGGQLRSSALTADGRHLLADVATSIGVLAGVMLALATGILLLDALVAALVSLHVLHTGWGVLRQNVSALIDESVPAQDISRIEAMIAEHAKGAIQIHDLKTRYAGRAVFLEFHLVVPALMPVEQAHRICDRIEKALVEDCSSLVVTIHVEPESEIHDKGGVPVGVSLNDCPIF